jgi:hypothetical protein
LQVFAAADKVQNLVGGGIEHHAVDGEIAALHIFARVFRETNFIGMTTIGVTYVGAEGCYFDALPVVVRRSARFWHQHHSELLADCEGLREDLHDLARRRVGGYVVVGGPAA